MLPVESLLVLFSFFFKYTLRLIVCHLPWKLVSISHYRFTKGLVRRPLPPFAPLEFWKKKLSAQYPHLNESSWSQIFAQCRESTQGYVISNLNIIDKRLEITWLMSSCNLVNSESSNQEYYYREVSRWHFCDIYATRSNITVYRVWYVISD